MPEQMEMTSEEVKAYSYLSENVLEELWNSKVKVNAESQVDGVDSKRDVFKSTLLSHVILVQTSWNELT